MPSCSCLNEKGNKILFRINIWPQPTTIAGLEEAGQGLASQVTRHHTNGLLPIQPHLSPDLHVANWFWIGSYCLYCSGSNLAFCKCQSLLSPVGCVSRSVAVRWNICSKLVWIFFSQNTSVVLLDFQHLIRPTLTGRSAAQTPLRHIVPWQ